MAKWKLSKQLVGAANCVVSAATGGGGGEVVLKYGSYTGIGDDVVDVASEVTNDASGDVSIVHRRRLQKKQAEDCVWVA